MKVLIIPDIHSRNFWREAVCNNVGKVDKVVFLGDYLDPYEDEIEENPDSIECKYFGDVESNLKMLNDIVSLKKSVPDKYILLTGNHTSSYIWETFSEASRTDFKHYQEYHNFFQENLDLFNLVLVEDDVIFSHAGITEDWSNKVWENMEYPSNEIPSILEIAIMFQDTPLKDFDANYISLISDISFYRGGLSKCGSCEWADIREHNIYSGEYGLKYKEYDYFQIFGHTQLKSPLITKTWACLDCRKGFIIDTKTHEINEC